MTYSVPQSPGPNSRRFSLSHLLATAAILCGLTHHACADAVIDGCTRSDLAAAVAEGGLVTYARACTISVNSPVVVGNTVTIDGGSFSNVLSGGSASRLFTVEAGGNLTLLNMRLLNGKASSGGAIYVKLGGTLVVSNCIFQANTAAGLNGAAGAAGADKSGTGDDGLAGWDGASGMGGAIYNAGICSAFASQFVTNSAVGGNGGAGGAGGDGNFRAGNGGDGGNGASVLGGAICNVGTVTVRDCSFERNAIAAGDGGAGGDAGTGGMAGLPGSGGAGGSALGAALYSSKVATVVQSTFSGNVAEAGNSAAGGTYSSGAGVLGENGGDAAGGALYTANGAAMTNLTVQGNRVIGGAGGNGGPGQFYGGNGGNGGTGSGGGIYNFGTLHVVNCTIADNSATGGTNGLAGSGNFEASAGTPGVAQGAGVMGGTPCYLQNSILAANTGGGNGAGSVVDRGYNISSDLSLTFSNTNSRAATNPRLSSLASNGGWTKTMALQTNSPAINKIPVASAPRRDQRGAKRPIENLADIGAYEAAFRLSGTVTAGGNPLPGATVAASNASATTDNAGKYEIYVSAGTNVLTPEKQGYFFTPAERTLNVTTDTANLNFTAATGFWITGSIVEFTNAVPDISVRIGTNFFNTDSNGVYRAYMLPATYTVTPQPGCYLFNPPSRTVTVGPDVSAVNFIAARQASIISGRVTDNSGAGMAGVSVNIGSQTVQTDAAGYYLLEKLCSASYDVRPVLAGYGFSPATTSVTVPPNKLGVDFKGYPVFSVTGIVTFAGAPLPNVAMTLGTNTVLTDTNGLYAFSVPSDSYSLAPSLTCHHFVPAGVELVITNDLNVDFTAQLDAYWITGRVLDGTNPVAGVSVLVGSKITTTGTNGTFAQSNLCAGTYVINSAKTGYAFEPAKIPVALGPSTNGVEVSFAAIKLYSVSGQVLVGTNPLASFKVQAGTNTGIGFNGKYTIEGLRPDTYTLIPSADCYMFSPLRQVTVGPDVTNADFAATRFSLAISGNVYHQDGLPVSGAAVSFAGVTLGTDPAGYFVLSGLCPATNSIMVSYPGMEFDPQTLNLENNISGLTITGYSTLTLGGRVTEGTNGLPGVTLTGSNSAESETAATSANGSYTLTLRSNQVYSVSPKLGDYSFVPNSFSVTAQPGITNVNFAAYPVLSIQVRTNGLMQLGFVGYPGITYRIQATTNFAQWDNISTNASPISFTDPASTNLPLRLYRLLRP